MLLNSYVLNANRCNYNLIGLVTLILKSLTFEVDFSSLIVGNGQ